MDFLECRQTTQTHVRGCTRCSTGTVHEMADGHWSAPCLIRLCTGEPSACPSVPCKHDLRIAYSDAVGSCIRLCQVHMRKQLSTATSAPSSSTGTALQGANLRPTLSSYRTEPCKRYHDASTVKERRRARPAPCSCVQRRAPLQLPPSECHQHQSYLHRHVTSSDLTCDVLA